MEKTSLWQIYDEKELQDLEAVNRVYRECLDEGKTERECVWKTIKMAEKEGYTDLRLAIKKWKCVKSRR